MQEVLKSATGQVALWIELIATIVVVFGVVSSVWLLVRRKFSTPGLQHTRRDVWVNFAAWLVFGLEFQLAADIIRTAIAPSWNQIGQLGAIAAIRTFLNYFLVEDLRRSEQLPPLVGTTASSKSELP